MNRIVIAAIVAIGLGVAAIGAGTASAQDEVFAGDAGFEAVKAWEACNANVDAATAATPKTLSNTAVAVEVNFNRDITNNIAKIDCTIELYKLLKVLGVPGSDWDAKLANAQAQRNAAVARAAFFDTVRCFQYNGGGGIECVAIGSPREAQLQAMGYIV